MKLFEGQSLFQWLGQKITGAAMTDAAVEKTVLDVSKQLYVKELALYTGVGLLADLISGCEFLVYRDGKPVHDSVWYRLNCSPNPNQSGPEFKKQWVTTHYYRGHSLVIPLAGQLFVADSFSRDEYPVNGDTFKNIVVRNLQLQRTFSAGDVYFMRQGDRNIKQLVDGVFISYGELLAAAQDAAKRAGGEKYALQLGRLPSGTEEEQQAYLARVQTRLQNYANASSAGYPLQKDQTLSRFSGSTSGHVSDLTALRKDVYAIVASALRIPEGLLSGAITSVDQVVNQALTFAVDPLAAYMGAEVTRKTFSQDDILYRDCRVVVDTSCILHIDPVAHADKLEKLISSGMCCIDENRRRCNMPELNTPWSQRHYITKNYDNVENTLDPLEGGENK